MFSNDNVRNRFKHKLYVTCICGTCNVNVDCLMTWISVEANELVSDEIHTILVGVSPWMWREREGGGGRERERERGSVL